MSPNSHIICINNINKLCVVPLSTAHMKCTAARHCDAAQYCAAYSSIVLQEAMLEIVDSIQLNQKDHKKTSVITL